MTTQITFELRKDADFTSGESAKGRWTSYRVRPSEWVKDRKTGEKRYTNYNAVFFAQSEAADKFLKDTLVAGRVVTISCDKLDCQVFTKDDGTPMASLDMVNARIAYSSFGIVEQQSSGQNSNNSGWGAPQQTQQRNQQQKPQESKKPNDPPMDFDDDIPF